MLFIYCWFKFAKILKIQITVQSNTQQKLFTVARRFHSLCIKRYFQNNMQFLATRTCHTCKVFYQFVENFPYIYEALDCAFSLLVLCPTDQALVFLNLLDCHNSQVYTSFQCRLKTIQALNWGIQIVYLTCFSLGINSFELGFQCFF